jgi:hypothetical protein
MIEGDVPESEMVAKGQFLRVRQILIYFVGYASLERKCFGTIECISKHPKLWKMSCFTQFDGRFTTGFPSKNTSIALDRKATFLTIILPIDEQLLKMRLRAKESTRQIRHVIGRSFDNMHVAIIG